MSPSGLLCGELSSVPGPMTFCSHLYSLEGPWTWFILCHVGHCEWTLLPLPSSASHVQSLQDCALSVKAQPEWGHPLLLACAPCGAVLLLSLPNMR